MKNALHAIPTHVQRIRVFTISSLICGVIACTHSVYAATPDGYMFLSYEISKNNNELQQITQLRLATFRVPLNAFEAELHFDPALMQVSEVIFHESLCEPRFIIDQQIDNEKGVVLVSCGSITPFAVQDEYQAVVTLVSTALTDATSAFRLGQKTGFYVHDGLGTRANVTVL